MESVREEGSPARLAAGSTRERELDVGVAVPGAIDGCGRLGEVSSRKVVALRPVE